MGTDADTLVALRRWQIITAATDERLLPTERGQMVAELAATTHLDAQGRARRYTTRTLYRWLAAWRRAGFEDPVGLLACHAARVKSRRWRWLVRVRSSGRPVHQASRRRRLIAVAAMACSSWVLAWPL